MFWLQNRLRYIQSCNRQALPVERHAVECVDGSRDAGTAALGHGLPCRRRVGDGRSAFNSRRSRAAMRDFELNPNFRTNPTERARTVRARRRHMRRSKSCGSLDHLVGLPASSIGGTSRPSVFADTKLIAKSNMAGCMTGKSAALSPFNIRPIKRPATWRAVSLPAMSG